MTWIYALGVVFGTLWLLAIAAGLARIANALDKLAAAEAQNGRRTHARDENGR